MPNRIEIRGVIVPSEYDVDFMYNYIQRGIITPESYIRKQIKSFDVKKDVDLYINSPGGSVFAGNEIINDIQDWAMTYKKNINITIGAMAASMGSALLVNLAPFAKSVKVHSNSKIMFHGAWGGAVGGSEAMKDYSELLDKINSDIKVKLVSRYGLNPDKVNEWFSEGREGWLDAKEALLIGMADEIIGQEADAPESADIDFKEDGMKIAALTLNKYKQENSLMNKLMAKLKTMLGISEDVSEDAVFELLDQIEMAQETLEEIENDSRETETDNESDTPVDEGTETEEISSESTGNDETDGNQEEDASVDAIDVDEEIEDLNDVVIEMQEKVEALNEALNKKQSENDKLKSDMDKLASRLEKFLGNGLNFEVEEEQPKDWKSCLEKCDGDYVAARKQFPEVYARLMGKN